MPFILASDARGMARDLNTLVFGGLVELKKYAVANFETLEQIKATNSRPKPGGKLKLTFTFK